MTSIRVTTTPTQRTHDAPGSAGALRALSILSAGALALSVVPTATASPANVAQTTAATSTTASSSASSEPSSAPPSGVSCPAVFGLALQGTGQSSPGASVDADTGFLSQLFSPLVAELDEEQFAREYIPYDSSMGGFALDGAHPVASSSYTDSVAGGLEALETRAAQIITDCDDTLVFPVGFSQGADVVDRFAAKVGAGDSEVPADRVAGAVVFGSPLRAQGADLLPGGASVPDLVSASSSQDSSSAAPTGSPSAESASQQPLVITPRSGEDSAHESALPTTSTSTATTSTTPVTGDSDDSDQSGVEELTATPATGAGLLPVGEHITDYGALSGRVGQFCTQGDLVCSTPVDAPLARVFSHAGAQLDATGDPFTILNDLGDAFSLSPLGVAQTVVDEDVSGTSLSSVRVDPDVSISQRLENAAVDPITTTDSSTGGSGASTAAPSSSASPSSSSSSTASSSAPAPAGGTGAATGADSATATPGTAAGVDDSGQKARAALSKLGVLGVDAVVQIAKKSLTADTIAQVAAVGLVNPAAGLTVLGAKVAASATQVLAPVGIRGAESVFNYAKAEVADNKGLIQMATDVTYWRHAQNHTSYGVVPVTGEGTSSIGYTDEWITQISTSVTAAAAEHTEDTVADADDGAGVTDTEAGQD